MRTQLRKTQLAIVRRVKDRTVAMKQLRRELMAPPTLLKKDPLMKRLPKTLMLTLEPILMIALVMTLVIHPIVATTLLLLGMKIPPLLMGRKLSKRLPLKTRLPTERNLLPTERKSLKTAQLQKTNQPQATRTQMLLQPMKMVKLPLAERIQLLMAAMRKFLRMTAQAERNLPLMTARARPPMEKLLLTTLQMRKLPSRMLILENLEIPPLTPTPRKEKPTQLMDLKQEMPGMRQLEQRKKREALLLRATRHQLAMVRTLLAEKLLLLRKATGRTSHKVRTTDKNKILSRLREILRMKNRKRATMHQS